MSASPTSPKRVGAICSTSGNKVELFGYGNYVGDEIPPSGITMFGQPLNRPNPKIVLDSGKVVWGCECWWGPENGIKKMLEGKEVVSVDIDEARDAARSQSHRSSPGHDSDDGAGAVDGGSIGVGF